MTDTTCPTPDPAASDRLELAPYNGRPAPADRDLGRPVLDPRRYAARCGCAGQGVKG